MLVDGASEKARAYESADDGCQQVQRVTGTCQRWPMRSQDPDEVLNYARKRAYDNTASKNQPTGKPTPPGSKGERQHGDEAER
jgi:hypothetical protein